jgi:hypothetical protein
VRFGGAGRSGGRAQALKRPGKQQGRDLEVRFGREPLA